MSPLVLAVLFKYLNKMLADHLSIPSLNMVPLNKVDEFTIFE